MPIEIRVPRQGWNMEEGVFLGWLKKDGDEIKPGDPIFTLETDKAAQDVESTDAGILRIAPDGPKEGDIVPVGTLLGYLVAGGESIPTQSSTTPAYSAGASQPTLAVSHSAPTIPRSDHPAISPRARRAARELGLDIARIQGTGRTGRIRECDVRAAIPSQTDRQRSLTPIRRAIADRMLASAQSTAPVTLTTTADATNLVALRNQFKATAQSPDVPIPSYTDIILKLTAVALQAHPALNARWEGEGIAQPNGIHIGIAVETDAGLVVPVLRNVPAASLRDVAARSRDFVARARARRLKPEEMQGGTFTVTNLGMYSIDAFTPIINVPECAILGIGRIQPQPAVVAGQVVAREQVTLSLTFDHRFVDGAPAARFLDAVRKGLENPGPLLMA